MSRLLRSLTRHQRQLHLERLESRHLLAAVSFGPEVVVDVNEASDILIVFGDLDGDGDLDMVGGDDGLFWYENTDGRGAFSAPKTIANAIVDEIAVNVRDIEVGDLNGDGYLDVVASSITDSAIGWWANDGAGNFGSRNLITGQASVGVSVELVDFDNDHDLDVIADGDGVDRYRNDGTGVFTTAGNFTFAINFLDTAHFDNDGVADVVGADLANDTITLLTASASASVAINDPGNLIAVDLDGDGDQDVVATSQADGSLFWYENTNPTDNFFQSNPAAQTIDAALPGAFDVRAGDLDRDGDLDLLASGRSGDIVAWYESDGAVEPSFTRHDIETPNHAENVAIADIDGDGILDISYVSSGDNRRVWRRNETPFNVVDSTSDLSDGVYSAGNLSLREAIELANARDGIDTISFDPSLAGDTLLLGGTPLKVTDDLIIDASPLTSKVTIDAGLQSRVFDFTGSAGNATLAGLAMTGGRTTAENQSGGGIRFQSAGVLSVTDSIITGNATLADNSKGGGIFTQTGSVLLTESVVSHNRTGREGLPGYLDTWEGWNSSGGGIYASSGDITLINSVIVSNSTEGPYSHGGGIFSGSGDTHLVNSTVSGNRVIWGSGGGIYANSGNLDLYDSVVNGNSTPLEGVAGIESNSGTVTLTGSQVDGNSGTGIVVAGSLEATNSRVSGNGGDGISISTTAAIIVGSTISENAGSGVANFGPNLSVTNTVIKDNQGSGLFNQAGILNVVAGTISGNQRGIRSSGELSVVGSTVSANSNAGVVSDGDACVTRSTISGNGSQGVVSISGNIFVQQSTISGNSGSGVASYAGAGDLILKSSTISANDASGVRVFGDDSDRLVSIENTIIAGHTGNGPNESDIADDLLGAVTCNYCLVGYTAVDLVGVGNQVGTEEQPLDPLLTPLVDLGGNVYAHSLLPGSPALDAGFSTETYDQRGQPFLRNDGRGVDIGAIEQIQLVVNSIDDSDDGLIYNNVMTLREAVRLANLVGGPDVILFDTLFDAPQSIELVSQLEIASAVTIEGPGAKLLTLDAGSGDSRTIAGDGHRLFLIDDGSDEDLDVVLKGLTLTGGDPNPNDESGPLAGAGGAIFSRENLFLLNSSVTGNVSQNLGGGLTIFEANAYVAHSALSGNWAASGGAMFSTGEIPFSAIPTTVSLVNSTISGNHATATGGGLTLWANRAAIANSTITQNTAEAEWGGIAGAPVTLLSGIVTNLENSIVAGNSDSVDAMGQGGKLNDLDPDVSVGFPGSVNHSLIQTTTGLAIDANSGVGNLLNVEPMLGPLADNGGPTETHALLLGSPAIDAGDPVFDPGDPDGDPQTDDSMPFDQRGEPFARVENGRIDIGAFEVQEVLVDSADFDNDGFIDGSDFLLWQRGVGKSNAAKMDGDADNDLNVDGDDLGIWQDQFGQPAPIIAASSLTAMNFDSLDVSITRASLVDAAMALVWIDGDDSAEDRSVIVEEEMEPQMPPQYSGDFIQLSISSTSSALAADSNSVSDETETTEQTWLTGELLESVFG